MEDLEKQLKSALERQEPPPWFEAKVLAAVARERPAPRSWFERAIHGSRLRWATAVAAVGLIASGVVWQRERRVEEERERTAGEAAKARLELALKITSNKLHKIQQKLNEISRAN